MLTPQDELSADLQRCFVSCNSALICSNVEIEDRAVPINAACARVLNEQINISNPAYIAGGLPVTAGNHSYMLMHVHTWMLYVYPTRLHTSLVFTGMP